MSNEFNFDFGSHYPGKQYWRGGLEELGDFNEELKVYHEGLLVLGEHLTTSGYANVFTIGYSAPNLMADMANLVDLSSLPNHVQLVGQNGWDLYSHPKRAQDTYSRLNIDFDKGVLVDDFAEIAKKALNINEFIVSPNMIELNYAFLTATNESIRRMLKIKIKPFVAVLNPSEKLIQLLKMRKSPSMTS